MFSLFALYNIPRQLFPYVIFPEISKGPDLWAFLTFLTNFKLRYLDNLLINLLFFASIVCFQPLFALYNIPSQLCVMSFFPKFRGNFQKLRPLVIFSNFKLR